MFSALSEAISTKSSAKSEALSINSFAPSDVVSTRLSKLVSISTSASIAFSEFAIFKSKVSAISVVSDVSKRSILSSTGSSGFISIESATELSVSSDLSNKLRSCSLLSGISGKCSSRCRIWQLYELYVFT